MIKLIKENWSKLTETQKKELVKKFAAAGTIATLLGSLAGCSKEELPSKTLSTETEKLYLVDVLEDKKGIALKDFDGAPMKYDFDEGTMAIVGAEDGKTKKGKDYAVTLVDSEGDLLFGYMDGKYLEDSYLDSMTVQNNDFTTYYVTASDGTLLKQANSSKFSTLLDINAQVLGAVSTIVDEEGYAWNEVLAVNNDEFLHGFVANQDLSKPEIIKEEEVAKTVDGDKYVVNIQVPLNVRSAANTSNELIGKLSYGQDVIVINDVEPIYDESYKWVYVSYENIETGKLCEGWIAAEVFATNEKYIVAKDEFVSEGEFETEEELVEDSLDINAASAVVLNVKNGQILFDKDAFSARELASITKILSAHIVYKYGNLDDTITYSSNAISVDGHASEGYSTGIDFVSVGTEITVKDALYVSLLKSDNSTTVALQEYIEEITNRDFAELMNEEAELIGCKKNNFTNSFGYEDPDHKASALDMAKILAYIYENDSYIIEVMGTESYTTHSVTLTNDSYPLFSRNSCAIGGKTGWTTDAGQTMVSIFEKDGEVIVVATLNGSGADSKYQDADKLANYGFEYIEHQKQLWGLNNPTIEDSITSLNLLEDGMAKTLKMRRN